MDRAACAKGDAAGDRRASQRRLNEALKTPAIVTALERLGAQARGGGPEALTQVVKGDTEKWAPIVKELGLRAD